MSDQVFLDAPTQMEEPSEEVVLDYARSIGIDPEKEPELLWIAKTGLAAPTPDGWKACKDDSSEEVYYFNITTGESMWDHPDDEKFKQLVIEQRKSLRPTIEQGNTHTMNGSIDETGRSQLDNQSVENQQTANDNERQSQQADLLANEIRRSNDTGLANQLADDDNNDDLVSRHQTDCVVQLMDVQREYENIRHEFDERIRQLRERLQQSYLAEKRFVAEQHQRERDSLRRQLEERNQNELANLQKQLDDSLREAREKADQEHRNMLAETEHEKDIIVAQGQLDVARAKRVEREQLESQKRAISERVATELRLAEESQRSQQQSYQDNRKLQKQTQIEQRVEDELRELQQRHALKQQEHKTTIQNEQAAELRRLDEQLDNAQRSELERRELQVRTSSERDKHVAELEDSFAATLQKSKAQLEDELQRKVDCLQREHQVRLRKQQEESAERIRKQREALQSKLEQEQKQTATELDSSMESLKRTAEQQKLTISSECNALERSIQQRRTSLERRSLTLCSSENEAEARERDAQQRSEQLQSTSSSLEQQVGDKLRRSVHLGHRELQQIEAERALIAREREQFAAAQRDAERLRAEVQMLKSTKEQYLSHARVLREKIVNLREQQSQVVHEPPHILTFCDRATSPPTLVLSDKRAQSSSSPPTSPPMSPTPSASSSQSRSAYSLLYEQLRGNVPVKKSRKSKSNSGQRTSASSVSKSSLKRNAEEQHSEMSATPRQSTLSPSPSLLLKTDSKDSNDSTSRILNDSLTTSRASGRQTPAPALSARSTARSASQMDFDLDTLTSARDFLEERSSSEVFSLAEELCRPSDGARSQRSLNDIPATDQQHSELNDNVNQLLAFLQGGSTTPRSPRPASFQSPRIAPNGSLFPSAFYPTSPRNEKLAMPSARSSYYATGSAYESRFQAILNGANGSRALHSAAPHAYYH